MKVITVDDKDRKIGEMEKLKAHEEGALHRAFSVFIMNKKGELLIQKRAAEKYHGGGLWSNTCCSHPTGQIKTDAERRLAEEMGFSVDLIEFGEVKYNLKVGKLIENEYDHLFIGFYDGPINPNPEEVSDYKWIVPEILKRDFSENPNRYTPWFIEIFSLFEDYYSD